MTKHLFPSKQLLVNPPIQLFAEALSGGGLGEERSRSGWTDFMLEILHSQTGDKSTQLRFHASEEDARKALTNNAQ